MTDKEDEMVVGRMTPGEDTPPESERALAVKKQHLERLIRDQAVGVSANLFAWLMMIAVRPEMVMRATKGDAQRAAQYLAGMTTGASLVEFILTPMLGRLSDTVGRRPFLIAAPAICTAARLVTFWGASNGSLSAVLAANWIDRCTRLHIYRPYTYPLHVTHVPPRISVSKTQWIGLPALHDRLGRPALRRCPRE